MSELKERIPNEGALGQAVERELPAIEARLRAQVGHLEQAYRRAQRMLRLVLVGGVTLFVAVMVILQFDAFHFFSSYGTYEPQSFLEYLAVTLGFFACLVLPLVIGGRLFWRNWLVVKQFNTETNAVIIKEVLSLFGASGVASAAIEYLPTAWFGKSIDAFATDKGIMTTQALDQSGLITNYDKLVYDDVFEFTHNGKGCFVAELEAQQWQGSGKSRRLVPIFKGYFAIAPLARTLQGVTYVTKDDDRHGFASLEPLSLFSQAAVKETVLEWNEFENLLHVATTDGVEARYILTTDFMATLYDWWVHHPGLIRVAFKGDHVYMLFSDDRIRLSATIGEINQTELRDYILSIARPLLHVIHLIEDVKV